MNTRLRRGVRRSHTPWRIFGYFLCEQKVTLVPQSKKPQPVCSDCGFAFKQNDYSPFTTKLGRLPSWMSFTLFHILLCARRKEPPVLPPRWGE